MEVVLKSLLISAVIFVLISMLTNCCQAKPRRSGRNRSRSLMPETAQQSGDRSPLRAAGRDSNKTQPIIKLHATRKNNKNRKKNGRKKQRGQKGEGDSRKQNTTGPTLSPQQVFDRQIYKQKRLESIRYEILDKLNFKVEPKVRRNNVTGGVPCGFPVSANTDLPPLIAQKRESRTFQPSSLPPSCNLPHKADATWTDENYFHLYFNIKKSDFPEDNQSSVTSVTLSFFKKPLAGDQSYRGKRSNVNSLKRHNRRHVTNEGEDNTLRITVYQYLRPLRAGKNGKKKLVAATIAQKNYEGFIKLDLKGPFLSWLSKPKKNFGIVIITEDSEGNHIHPKHLYSKWNCSETKRQSSPLQLSLALLDSMHNSSQLVAYSETQPSLDVFASVSFLKSSPTSRSKRHSLKRNNSLKKSSCKAVETYVTFEDLKWTDWIIQPRGFKYRVCRGSCSRLPRERYFKRRASGKHKSKPVEHECCAPTKFEPLQMIHLNDEQRIMVSIFEDFIVSECGCIK